MAAVQPPTSPWTPPAEVTDTLMQWLSWLMYFCLAASVAALIIFGALLIADKRRGEPVSATSPHMRVMRILLGVIIISSAGSLANYFFS